MDALSVRQAPATQQDLSAQTGSYTLHSIISRVPLSADGQDTDIRITCVEFWDGNLYIGTSNAEILHFVSIPPDPSEASEEPAFILASRLEPAHNQSSGAGVQQILVLPGVGKACVLCNGTLSFYSLPELSPAFPNKPPCLYVGGLDLNVGAGEVDSDGGCKILMCQEKRMTVVRVTEDGPRKVKSIEYGGCVISVRRDDFACSADQHSYALLDVNQQSKFPLFPISSLDEEAAASAGGPSESIASPQSHSFSRSVSSASTQLRAGTPERGHGRSTSLGIFNTLDRGRADGSRPALSPRHGFDAPESFSQSRSPWPAPSPERALSPSPSVDASSKPLPETPAQAETAAEKPSTPSSFIPLTPLIVSPTPNEFLLTTGTTPSEPGVGMFVNLDGDVVRGTLEFSSYPKALVTDGQGTDLAASTPTVQPSAYGYVLAVVQRSEGEMVQDQVEIQRWDLNPEEAAQSKEYLDLTPCLCAKDDESEPTSSSIGIRSAASEADIVLAEVSEKILQKVVNLGMSTSDAATSKHATDDDTEFGRRISTVTSRILLWTKDSIWWMVRNPLVIRLDARLELAMSDRKTPDRSQVESVLNETRGQEFTTEAEFLGLTYIRQKAAMLLFLDLVLRTSSNIIVFEKEKKSTEDALTEGDNPLDPRVILSLLPLLREEVVEGSKGVTVPGGLKTTIESFLAGSDFSRMSLDPFGPFGDNILQPVKRYLLSWRKRKGFGSISSDAEIFHSVDGALLRVLLLLDSQNHNKTGIPGSTRSELYGVVDKGVDCFERAVELLEEFNRLYVLSRLYQSRKMSTKVLSTWKRIIESGGNDEGEFTNGEYQVREYVGKIKNVKLVEEYGTWLARRTPKLGIEIFADENSRVKFEPNQVVLLLKREAPAAVKDFLEHLVFGKKQSQYSNDLIVFYLDNVVHELEEHQESRIVLLQTYETYRALKPPKPTYRQFIIENGVDEEWWQSRLRLLQLLGSSQEGAISYDVDAIRTRLAPFEQELVPEMIILNGRQGKHKDAIRLLTHGLGDFDTAISYCLLGGSTIFRPPSGYVPQEALPSRDEQSRLFGHLFEEFLRIGDLEDRIERMSELLERFGGWFDIASVLSMIPDDWSIDAFSAFLVSALRRLVRERSESSVTKALSGAQNLKISDDLIRRAEELGPVIERAQ